MRSFIFRWRVSSYPPRPGGVDPPGGVGGGAGVGSLVGGGPGGGPPNGGPPYFAPVISGVYSIHGGTLLVESGLHCALSP
jgi:hypothetical protein